MSAVVLVAAGAAAVAAACATRPPARRAVQPAPPRPAGRSSMGGASGRVAHREVRTGALVVLAVPVVALLGGATPALAVAVATATALVTARRARRRARHTEHRAGAVRALRALRADLTSGRDPTAAVAELGDAVGADPAGARVLDAALTLSRETGAPLAALVGRLAAAAAKDAETRLEREATLAAPRTTGRLLAGLPLLGVALGSLGGAGTAGFLLRSGAGGSVLLAGVVLDALGVLWLDRLAEGRRAGPR